MALNDKDHPQSLEPSGWQDTKVWLSSLPKSTEKYADALLTTNTNEKFIKQKSGSIMFLEINVKSLDKFAEYFGGDIGRTTDMINLISEARSNNEKLAIRIVDLFCVDSVSPNIKDVLSWFPTSKNEYNGQFSENDWGSLIDELKSKDSIFLTDQEMTRLNSNPGTAARRVVSALWSGRAEVEETKGNFKKSIEYYKEKYLKS